MAWASAKCCYSGQEVRPHHQPSSPTSPHLYDEDASGGQRGYLQVGRGQAQLGEADTQQQRTQQRQGQEVGLWGTAAHGEGVP